MVLKSKTKSGLGEVVKEAEVLDVEVKYVLKILQGKGLKSFGMEREGDKIFLLSLTSIS